MKYLLYAAMILSIASCGTATTSKETASNTSPKPSINFSGDSAWQYVQHQVDFGFRIPNTPEHAACADYLVHTLERHGATVIRQKADLKAWDGTILHSQNIIGSYNTSHKQRIVLCAHWDTRPWSDNDPDPTNHHKPILGANDGGSGVGVLLEVARQLAINAPSIGVDIIFFDSEDYGTPDFHQGAQPEDSWCLGAQHWAKNPHVKGYKAQYGILLDMVGAPNAVFAREYFSMQYAPGITNMIWSKAQALGFSHLFVDQPGTAVMDDHYYVNTIAGIPCANIIHYNARSQSGFADYWHTQQDDMSNISKHTLHAVGRTVLEVIYN